MILKMSITIICAGIYMQAKAQVSIQTDRPDQTECPFIVPIGYIQFETGTSVELITKENKIYSHPSLLIKYGISKHFELRLITESVSEKNYTKISRGFTPLTLGFKVNLWKEKGLLPLTSFIGHLSIGSVASPKYITTYAAPSFRFTMQYTLSKKISLGYNIGAEWNGETPEPAFIYTLTTGYSITEKIGSYIEIYGFAPQRNIADHRADAGFTYLIGNDFMVDISGGIGITDNAPKKYLAFGFSCRFNTKKTGDKKPY